MHPALEIQILLKIFADSYNPSESTQTSDRAMGFWPEDVVHSVNQR